MAVRRTFPCRGVRGDRHDDGGRKQKSDVPILVYTISLTTIGCGQVEPIPYITMCCLTGSRIVEFCCLHIIRVKTGSQRGLVLRVGTSDLRGHLSRV